MCWEHCPGWAKDLGNLTQSSESCLQGGQGLWYFDVCYVNCPGAITAAATATALFSWVWGGLVKISHQHRLFTPPILSRLLGEANIRSRKESLADSCSVLCCGWPGPLPMGPCFPGLENKRFWGWMFEAGLRQGPCASSKTEEVIPSNGTQWPWYGGDWMPSHQAACLILYKSHSLTGSLPAVCSVTGRQG